MKDEKILQSLLYCTKCYKSDPDLIYYIGECMHILCKSCISSFTHCNTCSINSNFIILDDTFKSKLKQNPTEAFVEPVEITMFQLSSALTLIVKQKTEIMKMKLYLKKMKDEVLRLRNLKKEDKKNGLFCFGKKDDVKTRINQIYEKNRNECKNYDLETRIDTNFNSDNKNHLENNNHLENKNYEINNVNHRDYKTSDIIQHDNYTENHNTKENNKKHIASEYKDYRINENDKRRNYLMDLTNRNKNKKYFTNYNRTTMSLSSSKSGRLTIPRKKASNEFKYIFRRQNGF